jgi:hypothetical protein
MRVRPVPGGQEGERRAGRVWRRCGRNDGGDVCNDGGAGNRDDRHVARSRGGAKLDLTARDAADTAALAALATETTNSARTAAARSAFESNFVLISAPMIESFRGEFTHRGR